MKRYAVSSLTGVISFACAAAVLLGMVVATYGPLNATDGLGAGSGGRRVLAYAAFLLVLAPAAVALVALPVVVARRWRINTLLAVVVACVLAGVVAHEVFQYLSVVNDCVLGHAFPYDVTGCD